MVTVLVVNEGVLMKAGGLGAAANNKVRMRRERFRLPRFSFRYFVFDGLSPPPPLLSRFALWNVAPTRAGRPTRSRRDVRRGGDVLPPSVDDQQRAQGRVPRRGEPGETGGLAGRTGRGGATEPGPVVMPLVALSPAGLPLLPMYPERRFVAMWL